MATLKEKANNIEKGIEAKVQSTIEWEKEHLPAQVEATKKVGLAIKKEGQIIGEKAKNAVIWEKEHLPAQVNAVKKTNQKIISFYHPPNAWGTPQPNPPLITKEQDIKQLKYSLFHPPNIWGRDRGNNQKILNKREINNIWTGKPINNKKPLRGK